VPRTGGDNREAIPLEGLTGEGGDAESPRLSQKHRGTRENQASPGLACVCQGMHSSMSSMTPLWRGHSLLGCDLSKPSILSRHPWLLLKLVLQVLGRAGCSPNQQDTSEARVWCLGCVCKARAYPGEPFEVGHRGKGQRNVLSAPAPIGAIQRLKCHSQAVRDPRPARDPRGFPKCECKHLQTGRKCWCPAHCSSCLTGAGEGWGLEVSVLPDSRKGWCQ